MYKVVGLGITLAAFGGAAEAKTFRWGGITDAAAEVIDVSSMVRTGSIAQGWAVFVRRDDSDAKAYTFSLIKSEWDCTGKRRRNLGGAHYSQQGESVGAVAQLGWVETIPDTMGAATLAAACLTVKADEDAEFQSPTNFTVAADLGIAITLAPPAKKAQ